MRHGTFDPVVRCGEIALLALDLDDALTLRLEQAQLLSYYRSVEMPMMEFVSTSDKSGVPVHMQTVLAYVRTLRHWLRDLRAEAHRLSPWPFSLNSTKCVSDACPIAANPNACVMGFSYVKNFQMKLLQVT